MYSTVQFLRRAPIVAIVMMFLASQLFAQQVRGALRGVVKDEFGALITGATVAVSDAKGERKTATTSGDGTYVFDGLVTGAYTVSATAPGFATSVETPIEIRANQRAALEITLKVTIAEQRVRSEEHTSELQSQSNLVCRLLLEKKKKKK